MNQISIAPPKVDLRRGVDHIGIAVTLIIHDGNGRVLLLKRGEQARDEQGRWDNCSGAVEFGESIDEAIRREVKEELCVEPSEIEFSHCYDAHRTHVDGSPTHWISLVHLVRVDPEKVRIGEPHKVAEIGWFTKDTLPKPVHSQFWRTTRPAIDRGIIRGSSHSQDVSDDYHKLIAFLGEAEKLKSTLRHNWTTTGRQEDSAQHAWRAAVFFVILHGTYKFDVDPYKTLAMLIIHDLPEVEFGDIPAFVKDNDPEKHAAHKAREAEAARKLYAILPGKIARELTKLQEEFDAGETKEARVAKALEKIESQLQHLESGTEYWGEHERGEHMIHYPDKAVDKLDNEHVSNIWKIIQKEIYDLTYPEKQLPPTR